MSNSIEMIGAAELSEIMGCSIKTAREIFCLVDFPSCDFGKEKKAEINAVRDYFSVPRRRKKYFR